MAVPFSLMRSILWSLEMLTVGTLTCVGTGMASEDDAWSPAPQIHGRSVIWALCTVWANFDRSMACTVTASPQSAGSCVPTSAFCKNAMARDPHNSEVKNRRCSRQINADSKPKALASCWRTLLSPSCCASALSQVKACSTPCTGVIYTGTQWCSIKTTVMIGRSFWAISGWSLAQNLQSKPLPITHAVEIKGSMTHAGTMALLPLSWWSRNAVARPYKWNLISSSAQNCAWESRIWSRSSVLKNWCLKDHNCCGETTFGRVNFRNCSPCKCRNGVASSHGWSWTARPGMEHSPTSNFETLRGGDKISHDSWIGCDQVAVGEIHSSILSTVSWLGRGLVFKMITCPTSMTWSNGTFTPFKVILSTSKDSTSLAWAFRNCSTVAQHVGWNRIGESCDPSMTTVHESACMHPTVVGSSEITGASSHGVGSSSCETSGIVAGTFSWVLMMWSKTEAMFTEPSRESSHRMGNTSSARERSLYSLQNPIMAKSLASHTNSWGAGHTKRHLMRSHDLYAWICALASKLLICFSSSNWADRKPNTQSAWTGLASCPAAERVSLTCSP